MTSPELLPEDFPVFVRFLLAALDMSQEELAETACLSSTTIGNYRAGKSTPARIRATVERLARAVRLDLSVVDLYVIPAVIAVRNAGNRKRDDAVDTIIQNLKMELQGLAHLLLPLGPDTRDDGSRTAWRPADVARQEALLLWSQLEGCDDADCWHLVERWREFQHPGLAELLCDLSTENASNRADQAVSLAELARRIAELVPGEAASKARLLGYTLIFLANALRVAGELAAARKTFQEGLTHWNAGAGSSTTLAEWRVLDLEASLLRDEREFDQALAHLAKALYIAPSEFAGRIHLNISTVYEQKGDGERAIRELRRAELVVDLKREPRLYLVLRFNLATALCLVDRPEEAEKMYPEIRELASALQNELDNVRLRWLAGRIHAGRGRLDEADAALEEVRQHFTAKRSPWDCSLATLELATVRLRKGLTAEVRDLSAALVWIFEAQGIHQEALAALALFQKAADHDRATADFTDRITRYLRKAKGDPKLRFGE